MATRIVPCLVLGLAAGLAVWQVSGRPLRGEAADPAWSAAPGPLFWRGRQFLLGRVLSWGSPPGSKGSEQTTWASCDPHARAYEVLFEERSRLIVKNYYNLSATHLAEPEKVTLCLKCHVAPDVARKPGVPPLFRADGVSCESCHGPASCWLTQHYLPSWKGLSPGREGEDGLPPDQGSAGAGPLCADCHVGAPEMEVNHDLLAAGHPRLNFEFGSFQAIYPKHWCDRDDRARYPDFEARSWALGQAVSAQAALTLLANRASDKDKPWPEFAENNCYSCHHELRAGGWRKPEPGQKLGALSLNDWYYAELPGVLRLAEQPTAGRARTEVAPRRDGQTSAAARAGRRTRRAGRGQLAGFLQRTAMPPPLGPGQLRSLLFARIGPWRRVRRRTGTKRRSSTWPWPLCIMR